MRNALALASASMMLVSGNTGLGDARPAPGKQFQVKLRFYDGDPLGSRWVGTLRIRAEAGLVTGENRGFSFLDGGDVVVPDGRQGIQFVPVGLTLRGKVGAARGGKIHVDFVFANTVAVGKDAKDRVQLRTESTRFVGSVGLAEVVRLGLGQAKAGSQIWAEVVVKEAKP
jgi:hypothetical protein